MIKRAPQELKDLLVEFFTQQQLSERCLRKKNRDIALEALDKATDEIHKYMKNRCVKWDFIFTEKIYRSDGRDATRVRKHFTEQLSGNNAVLVEYLKGYSEYD